MASNSAVINAILKDPSKVGNKTALSGLTKTFNEIPADIVNKSLNVIKRHL
jgi:hypothetical protein